MDWKVITLIVATVIFFLIILQLIYIRIRITGFEDDIFSKKNTIDSVTDHKIKAETKLRMYGMVIDGELTKKCNMIGSVIFERLYSALNPSGSYISLPFICPLTSGGQDYNKLELQFVQLKQCGFLFAKGTSGANSLRYDIMNGHVTYIVIKNSVFYITFNADFSDQVVGQVLTESDVKYEPRTVFVLYSIVDAKSTINADCKLDMIPFMGSFWPLTSVDQYNIDIMNQVIGSTNDGPEVSIHVAGYTTMS